MSRRGGTTQHARLAEQLVAAIVAGDYAVGDRLPTEAELCAEHGLSRGTVRQAMRHLEDQGLISRRPGAGTTVISRQPLTRYVPLASSTSDIIDFVRYTEVRNPETSEVLVDGELADRLGVRAGALWFRIQGLRSMRSGEHPPMCWSEQYLRAELPGRDVLAQSSFDQASIETHRIEQEVRAEPMPERFAAALGVAAGSPALVVARRHFNDLHGLLSVSLHTHPGDRFKVTSVLLPVTGCEA